MRRGMETEMVKEGVPGPGEYKLNNLTGDEGPKYHMGVRGSNSTVLLQN